MYGKIENSQLVFAPDRVVIDNMQIFNPTGAQYRTLGYKLLVYSTPPEPREGYHLVYSWTEESEIIVQNWDYELNDWDAAEALNVILGE